MKIKQDGVKGPNNYGKVVNTAAKPKGVCKAKSLSGGKLSQVPKPKGKIGPNDTR